MKLRISLLTLIFATAALGQWKLLTNADIMEMKHAGISDERVIRVIETVPEVKFIVEPEPAVLNSGISKALLNAMVARISRGGPMAEPVAPSGQPQKSHDTAGGASRPVEPASAWTLRPGHAEFVMAVGGNGTSGGNASYSVGTDLHIGITRYASVWGGLTYNNLITVCSALLGCDVVSKSLGIVEYMAGVRLSYPGKISPFVVAGVGGLSDYYQANYFNGLVTTSQASGARFAEQFGGGLSIGIRPHVGVRIDARYVRSRDDAWYVRTMGGLFFQF